jgi:hypothetical protein
MECGAPAYQPAPRASSMLFGVRRCGKVALHYEGFPDSIRLREV